MKKIKELKNVYLEYPDEKVLKSDEIEFLKEQTPIYPNHRNHHLLLI